MMYKKCYRCSFVLFFLVIVEVLSQTFWFELGNKKNLSLLYFASGILISIIPLFKINFPQVHSGKKYYWLSWLILLMFFAFLLFSTHSILEKWLLNYKVADMLPIIEIMGRRWLNGEAVYAAIPEIWGGMQPVYLPAMWLPYVPALAFDFDLRWINVFAIIIGLSFFFHLFSKNRDRSPLSLLCFVPLGLLLWYIFKVNSSLFAMTEEPVVIAYYLFLGYALLQRNPLMLGLSLAFCFLSRYTLAFWAVPFLAYSFFFISKKVGICTSLALLISSGLLLAVSQGMSQFDLFIDLQSNYLADLNDPDKKWGIIKTINENLGLAKFIAYENLPILHRCLLWGSLLLPVLAFMFFHFCKTGWLKAGCNEHLFYICSLKLSLVYFYNMLPQPYSYLFYTSTFLSIGILYVYLNGLSLSRNA